jgi:hypothetical protein
LVPVLQGDHGGLERPQHQDRAAKDQRRPKRHVNPDRRRKFQLDPDGEPDNEHSEEKDDEHRRPVAGILSREIEAANRTGRAHRQQTIEQRPLAAARAAAGQGRPRDRDRRERAPIVAHPAAAKARRAVQCSAGSAAPMPHQ